MKIKYMISAILIGFSLTAAVVAQEDAAPVALPEPETESLPTLTLAQAIGESQAKGDDFALADQTLGIARLQHSADVAKQGFAVSAGGAWSMTDGLKQADPGAEQTLLSKAESASLGSSTGSASGTAGIGQTAQGSLSLSTPQTKLSVSATHSLPPSTAAVNTATTVVALTASQTLWDGYFGGQSRGTLEKSRLTLLGKELADTQSRSAIKSKIKQAYIIMLAAQRDLAVKRQVLEKQKRLLAQIQAIYNIRQASAIDLKTAQINARSAEIDALTADKSLRLANERLAVLVGRAPDERFLVADIPDPVLPAASVDEAIKTGLSRRNDLAQFELSAKSAGIDAALARASKSPLVTLTGGAGIAVGWTSPSAMEEAVTVGARIALPVLDSGAASFQAKTGQAQSSLYGLQASQLRKTLASDIRDYFESTQLLAEKTELARQSAELAEAQFELVKTQNKFGTATMQDVLTASVTAATAEVNYGTVKNQYLLSELSLETAMGL